MMKTKLQLCVVLTLVLGITWLPTLSPAAEFSYTDTPAFTVTYPKGSTPDAEPGSVWAIKPPGKVRINAFVNPITEGVELKDATEKLYKPRLEKAVGATAKMVDNKEITLSDGTKAYYSELEWTHPPTQAQIVTVKVTVYKDGKVVSIIGHPWKEGLEYKVDVERAGLIGTAIKVVRSLKFK